MSQLEKSIGNKQIEIIENISKHIKDSILINKDISLSDYFYFNSWAESFGKKKLIKILGKKQNFFNKIYLNLKLIYRKTLLQTQEYLTLNNYNKKKEYNNLILTYCDSSDLKKEKIYDRFFSSYIHESQNTLWLIINLSFFSAQTNNYENLILFNKKKRNFISKVKFISLFLINLLLHIFHNKNLYFKEKIIDSVTEKIKEILSENKIKKLIMPFESQPLQHAVLMEVKNYDKKINTIGYLHSALPPLPTDFIFKGNSPDVLLVHGSAQKNILTKKLGWPNDVVTLTKSFRYQKKNPDIFLNKIFLPYAFDNPNLILNKLEKLYETNIQKLLPTFEIINHPYMINSKRHKVLINNIEKKMNKYNNKSNQYVKNKISIFIGATAAILEALEHDVSVLQICSEPIFESHNSAIWDSISVTQLDPNIFKYELINKSSIIEFGEKSDFLKKYNILST